jgi:hypothetical protein
MAERSKQAPPNLTGVPAAAGPALLDIVDADEPPLRVFFGTVRTMIVLGLYQSRLDTSRAPRCRARSGNLACRPFPERPAPGDCATW